MLEAKTVLLAAATVILFSFLFFPPLSFSASLIALVNLSLNKPEQPSTSTPVPVRLFNPAAATSHIPQAPETDKSIC